MTDALPQVDLYTDGGCRPNPGPGGWGVVVLGPGEEARELSGGVPDTTNNRMELQAAVAGLRALDGPRRVRVHTDSEYLRKGISQWLPRWRANGWRTAGRAEVKNQDLWRELEAELERHRVSWHWVKGHAGDRWNERADALAAAAIPRPDLPVDDPSAVHLYLAAAYSGSAKAGAWGAVLIFGDRDRVLAGRLEGGSANRMHLEGAIAGLGELRRPVRVQAYTVSDYLHDGATTWLGGWKARGWRTREGSPVAHREAWQRLEALMGRHEVHWHVLGREQRPEGMERAKAAARDALRK